MHDWYSPAARRRWDELDAKFGALQPEDTAGAIERALAAQVQWVDRECVNLNPAANLMNPRAERLMTATAATRPSLGHAGEKYETGLYYSEEVEFIATTLAARLFGAKYAEVRALSGSMANLMVYMACAKAGDPIFALSPECGGHATHQNSALAGLYGLNVHALPWNDERWDVDHAALERSLAEIRPKMVVLGASLVLKPYDVERAAELAHRYGAFLHYDAAHMAGVIAGGVYPNPLAHGADVMTMSTYKMYGGPQGGLVLTNDAQLAQRIDDIAYPGLTANFNVARVATLAVSTADLLAHGARYARDCVENARALARALRERGLNVVGPEPELTFTHHILVDAVSMGGGDNAARLLEPANILASAIGVFRPGSGGDGMRLGSSEVTRIGMGPAEMERIAQWIADVLLHRADPKRIARDVRELRGRFQSIEYVLDEPVAAAAGSN